MSYAIKTGTNEAQWIDDKPTPDGHVRYDGEMVIDADGRSLMVWDDLLQNIREKTQSEKDADQAATDLVEADRTDFRTQYALAITRLDEIIAGADTATTNQLRTAMADMARIVKRHLKYTKAS